MQKHHLLWLLLPALTACNSPKLTPEEIIWQRCDSVLNAIQLTSIPSTEFNIKDYGALAVVEGRDTAIATMAIDAAIKAANQAGGGTVVIPDSTYFTGPIPESGQIRNTIFPTICSSAMHPTEEFLESMETSRLSPITKMRESGTW